MADTVLVAPFRGWPKAEITFGPRLITIEALSGNSRRLVFEAYARDYRPGIGSRSLTEQARDIFEFAQAYAERPEEFDREPEDAEQAAADWWAKYGDEFAAELNSMIEDEES